MDYVNGSQRSKRFAMTTNKNPPSHHSRGIEVIYLLTKRYLLSLQLDYFVQQFVRCRDRFRVGLEATLILDHVYELCCQVDR